MIGMNRAAGAALVVTVGVLGLAGASSTADAQRPARPASAAQGPTEPRPTTPYPGASVIIDPRFYPQQPTPGPLRRRHPSGHDVVYYIPVPTGYPSYYPSAGYGGGGGVYDTNGRPLYTGFDAPAPTQSEYPHGTPDLSGSPYVVVDGGMMVVDFGNGDRRAVPSCVAQASQGTPDGRSRTIFYRPPADGVVLRGGQQGRVIGAPTAGARVCYTVDTYGRMVLDY